MRVHIKCGVGVAAGLVCVLAGAQPAPAADADTYSLVNEATGRCLDGRSLTGTLPCDGGDSQKWAISTRGEPGSVSLLRNATGCLTVRTGGRVLSTGGCDGMPHQQWKLSRMGSTSLKNVGSGRCVDDLTDSLRMNVCGAGEAGQRWVLRP